LPALPASLDAGEKLLIDGFTSLHMSK
jgi:hypothetical protein